jgi:hypothetical protein
MAKAREVTPGAWSDILVLYDDGEYSAVWGRFRNSSHRMLGVRWNGKEGEVGYPNQGGHPLWYVEPPFVERSIILGLGEKLRRSPHIPQREQYLQNLAVALNEAHTM